MTNFKKTAMVALLAGLSFTGAAQASLMDRGNGMIFDNVLNITWLQDANYAKTSGYDADGLMTLQDAQLWASGLVYGGFNDWRLAGITGPERPVHYSWWFGTEGNYGQSDTELSYMYYVNLGQDRNGILGSNKQDGQSDFGLVHNLQAGYYLLSGTAPDGYGNPVSWSFNTTNGDHTMGTGEFYAWAVRPGDVSAVPVPGAAWLFGSGLLGLLGFKRRGNIR